MWIITFFEKADYVDVFGRKIESYRVGVGEVEIFILPPSKDIGDFIFQSYPAHMFLYYWAVKTLSFRDNRAIIFPFVSSVFWELVEEKILKTTPVSEDSSPKLYLKTFASIIPSHRLKPQKLVIHLLASPPLTQ
jgi:hypothetical protein